MIWFGRLSAILQLASRVGGKGELGKFSPYHYTTWLRGREGVAFPPLGTASTVACHYVFKYGEKGGALSINISLWFIRKLNIYCNCNWAS